MPRQARIDAPTALHHVIIRGIERREIFTDEEDRRNFLKRFAMVLTETETPCYAWVLLSNHAHFLLRTGMAPLAGVMKRVLTGYAQQYNRRHERVGHLFQNRYKSILCEEDAYCLELVRYIHLNPVRAGIVKTFEQLARYRYSGHGSLIGTAQCEWQDTDYILRLFGKTAARARKQYVSFIADGFRQGHKAELTGGGLLRSNGGWRAVAEQLRQGNMIKGDERILGGSDFVMEVLEKAGEQLKKSSELKIKGVDFEAIVKRVTDCYGLDAEDIVSGARNRRVAEARSVVCYAAVRKLGESCEAVALKLHISASGVSKAVSRGRNIVVQGKKGELFFE